MGSRTIDYLQEQPLLLGALGITVGAALGMLLPSSRYEREMLRRSFAKLGRGRTKRVGDVRSERARVAESVLDTAQEATRREGLSDRRPRSRLRARAGRGHGWPRSARGRGAAAAGREAVERELAADDWPASRPNGPSPDGRRHDDQPRRRLNPSGRM